MLILVNQMCMVCFAGSGTHSWSPVSMFSSLPSLFHSMLTLSFTLFSVLATESYWSWPKLEVYIKDIFLSPSLLCAVDRICSSCYSSPLTIFATFFFADYHLQLFVARSLFICYSAIPYRWKDLNPPQEINHYDLNLI